MAIGTMPPGAGVVNLEVFEQSPAHGLAGDQAFPMDHSTLSVWKKLSAQALS
jgi:hypothetical protein